MGRRMQPRSRGGHGRPGSVRFWATFDARIWDPSITELDQSSAPAACNSASNDSCICCQTPASFQSRNRRQQVIPDPNTPTYSKIILVGVLRRRNRTRRPVTPITVEPF